MRSASVVGLVLGACGRLGFDAQAVQVDGVTLDVSIDQAVDECGVAGEDTVALYTFDGSLGGDALGNHPGSVRGNVSVSTARCGATAALFDTGYVLVPDAPAFDLGTGSVEMFARLSTASNDNQTLIARDALGETLDGHFLILITPGAELIARLQFGGASHFRCAAFPIAQWVHVGLSFGGTSSQGFRMWLDHVEATMPAATLDGGPIDCTIPAALGIAGNDNPLVIGASNARTNAEGEPDPVITQAVIGGEIDQVHVRTTWRDFGP